MYISQNVLRNIEIYSISDLFINQDFVIHKNNKKNKKIVIS